DPTTGAPSLLATSAVGDLGWHVIVTGRRDALQAEVDQALAQQRALRLGLSAALLIGAVLVGAAGSAALRRRREAVSALEQQTATAAVLRAIAASPTNVDPVLDAIAATAARFCGAADVSVLLVQGDEMPVVAHHGPIPSSTAGPLQLERTSIAGTAVLDRRTVIVTDVTGPEGESLPQARARVTATGQRGLMAAPLIREGKAIGAILLRKLDTSGFDENQVNLVEAFADQAVIAIENVRLFNETREALERQTAISEILRVMSASPTSEQPVLDAIADSARRFCAAEDATVALVDGDRLTARAHVGPLQPPQGLFALDRTTVTTRSIVDAKTVHVTDLQAEEEEFPIGSAQAKLAGQHTTLATPLLREGKAIGAILLRRSAIDPFSDRQIDLLRTFADQAVIAIENVRLFNETAEALERQTAISEILRVMSSSPTDVRPVLEAVAESARRFCAAEDATVCIAEGDVISIQAHAGAIPPPQGLFRIDRTTVPTRSMLDLVPIQVADLQAEEEEFPTGAAQAKKTGQRTTFATPLMSKGVAIGAILLRRRETRLFTDKQVELARTFADQAAIAIENVRLFNETTEALERQTAVAAVLKTISQTAFDLQAVFDVVVENATKLCRADFGYLFRRDGDLIRMVASAGGTAALNAYELAHPTPVGSNTLVGRTVQTRDTVHIRDFFHEPGYDWPANLEHGVHTGLAVPIFSGDDVVAVIGCARYTVAPYAVEEIRLLETFASQASIAIENARLFHETETALERQTAVADVLKTVSRSAFDLEPILETVVENAARLVDAEVAWISRTIGDDAYRIVAHSGEAFALPEVSSAWSQLATMRIPHSGSLMGRLLRERRVIHITDVTLDPELWEASGLIRATGVRTVLAVPMLRESVLLGGVIVGRKQVRPYTPRDIELVETFADQAAIAIENVRLFNETKEALERQTAVSELLGSIS
ncbi:MAG: GAF domain-containing protein, partial [Chloroflexota bacterium]